MLDVLTLTCDKCKKEYQLNKKTYDERKRKGRPNYCKECMKIYSVELVKSSKANMSEERKREYYKKLSEANKKYWVNLDDNTKEVRYIQLRKQNDDLKNSMTPEKRKEHTTKIAEGKAKMTEDQIQQMKEKMSKSMTTYHTNMTQKEKEIFSQQIKDGMNKMSDTEKQVMKDAWVIWWNSLSDEAKYDHNKKLNEDRDNWWANITSEDKEKQLAPLMDGLNKFWNSMTPEEKAAFIKPKVEKLRESRDLWWNNLTSEEKAAIMRKTIISGNGNNNFHKRFETRFNESHLSNKYYIKPEVVLHNENVMHSWDYGVYNKSNDKLEMVIDLDGSYYHADNCDYDGMHSKEEYDECRSLSISSDNNTKHFIIQEGNFNKCFELMIKELMLNYDEYVQYIFKTCRAMPFPYPKYNDSELVKSYSDLCKMNCNDKYHQDITLNTRLGDRLINHFHHSIYHAYTKGNISPYEAWYNNDMLKKVIENRIIYQTYLNPNKILQGFNISKVATKVSVFSAGRARLLINKYLSEYDTIFDPFSGFSGRMLGTISLGKKYIGQDISEIHVNESNGIINFLRKYGFNVDATINQCDILQSSGEYQCLFTCPPYSTKEQWLNTPLNKLSCDEWIDICLSRFNCKYYLFIVDDTKKYKDSIVDIIDNRSHFGSNPEYVVLIKKH